MKTSRPALILALLLVAWLPLSATTGWSAELGRQEIVRRAIEFHIRPGFERFSNEAELAQADMEALCAVPSPAALESARRRFASLVSAWARIEFLRFGPLVEDNRADRIHFWPDRRGIGLRQVQRILAKQDASATDAQMLYGKSVAVQGLTALEFVLFGTGADSLDADTGDPFRCRYGATVAANLARISEDLETAWNDEAGFSATLLKPGEDNQAYRTEDEALGEIVNVMVHGFETLRDIKLQPILGETVKNAAPRRAIFRRSGQTLAVLEGNFQSLQHLFEVSGIIDAVPEKQKWIGGSMLLEFENAQRTFDGIRLPIEQAVENVEQRGKLTYLVILTRSLQRLAAEQLAVAMDLAVGFSSLDGD